MFPIGQQYNVPGLKFEAKRDRTDGMRCIQGKDDLSLRTGMDELGNGLTCALDALIGFPLNAAGHLFGKPVLASSAAAGRIARIIVVYGFYDRSRHQCGARVIEVYGRFPIPSPVQRGKVFSTFVQWILTAYEPHVAGIPEMTEICLSFFVSYHNGC